VADIGCGFGASTILMARQYPASEFFGFDYHAGSIDLARTAAEREGLSDRLHFEVAPAGATPARTSTSSPSSTASMTSATLRAQPPMFAPPSNPTESG